MDEGQRRERLRPFVLGGVIGAAGALAAARRRRPPPRRQTPAGLAAFERAPCYRELLEREEQAKR